MVRARAPAARLELDFVRELANEPSVVTTTVAKRGGEARQNELARALHAASVWAAMWTALVAVACVFRVGLLMTGEARTPRELLERMREAGSEDSAAKARRKCPRRRSPASSDGRARSSLQRVASR